MNLRIKKENISYYFLLIAIMFYFSYYFITNSYMYEIRLLSKISTVLLYSSIVVLILSIITHFSITKKQLLLATVLILIGFLVSRNVENTYAFTIIILFLLAGRGKEPEKIYTFCFWVNMIWLFTIILFAKLGIISNVESSTLTHAHRVYLGFTAPNAEQLFFFCILLFISYKKNQIKGFQIIAFFSISLWLHRYNDMNAAFYFSWAVLILLLVARTISEKFWRFKLLPKISFIIIPLCVILSFVFPVLYSKNVPAIVALDTITSTRISLGAQALEKYDVRLFGQLINFNYTVSGSYNSNALYFYIDSSYLKYILLYGIIFIGIILYLYHKMIQYVVRNKEIYILLSTIAALTYFIWNPQLLYIPYNPFLIVLLSFWDNKRDAQQL